MTVHLGINPIGWTNDCMRWLGELVPLDTCLAEARQAGFSGVELGRKFPRDAARLGPLLERHDLRLVSGWYSARLRERDAKAEIAAMHDHLTLLRTLGASVMVFAETTGEIINQVGAPASARPAITSAAEWRRLGRRFTQVAEHLAEAGVPMAVHHHMGTVIQSEDDVERLMENSGDVVGLLLDTGHLTYAGGDPLRFARRYGARINHVHCKDIRKYALAACQRRDASFSEAVLHGLFTAPGDGIVDFRALFGELAKLGYGGWLIQEAEQDPTVAPPLIYAELGASHMRKLARAAKLAAA